MFKGVDSFGPSINNIVHITTENDTPALPAAPLQEPSPDISIPSPLDRPPSLNDMVERIAKPDGVDMGITLPVKCDSLMSSTVQSLNDEAANAAAAGPNDEAGNTAAAAPSAAKNGKFNRAAQITKAQHDLCKMTWYGRNGLLQG